MGDRKLISNRYKLGELLGEGGMGDVYRGTDTQTGRPIAIKVLNSHPVANRPGMVERFSREAEALKVLNHPNIVKVFTTSTEDTQHYIIMEFVEGGSLRDLLDSEGQLSITKTLTIALDLADALTRTHRMAIIHRDIKPANILLTDDGTARLSDFGLAKVGDLNCDRNSRLTQAGTILGTFEYLSPEACRGEVLDARTDIWALGIILFEMLAGKLPFVNQPKLPIFAMISNILTQPVPDLEELRPDAPAPLIDLIYRMLTKEREARIPSMRLVGAELEIILQGLDDDQLDSVKQAAPPRFVTPTPYPADIPRHNLPKQTTPFIGRESELANLAKLITSADNHLITILGPGGTGKTRLALEAAHRHLNDFESGVTFVSLAPIQSAENIVPAIAEAMELQFYEGLDPKEQLIESLCEKQTLLVLDNFEHLLEGADLVSDILQAGLGIKVLITSREKLNLHDEVWFRIRGLDCPKISQTASLETAQNYSAIRLFMQAAKRARPSFELEKEDLLHVAQICQMVNGMPLGIILAGAWVEMFSPSAIAEEISRSLDFLETEVSDLPKRHRSMRAVFDSSWQQLSENERDTFMKLTVFRGGFRREAAQAVAGADLNRLIKLVSKSLLHRDPDSGRYEIHELLRQYVEVRLETAGQIETVRQAHGAYYARFMEERRALMLGPRQVKALDEIETEFENVRRAWHWAVENRDYQAIDQSSESLFIYSDMRSREFEGVALFKLALDELTPFSDDKPHPAWERLLLPWYDLMLQSKGRPKNAEEIKTQAKKHLENAHKRDDSLGIAYGLILLGHFVEPVEAIKLYEHALVLVPRLDDSFWVQIRIGFCQRELGVHEKEIEAFKKSYERGREIGESEKMGWALQNLGETEIFLSDHLNAIEHFREANAHFHQVGTVLGIIRTNIDLSFLTLLKGDFEDAKRLISEARELAKGANRLNRIKRETLIVLGYIALVELDSARAKCHFEEILSADPASPEASLGLACIASGLDELETARQHLREALCPETPYLVPAMVILCLPVAAFMHKQDSQLKQAVELLALSFTHPQGPKDLLEKWTWVSGMCTNLEEGLGLQVFKAAWARGEKLDLTETLSNLMDHFEVETPSYQPAKIKTPIQRQSNVPMVEPLSERELEILQLLKTELSGPEIAHKLTVSLNTFRFHTKNIYTKLGVNNRRSAVSRALELNL